MISFTLYIHFTYSVCIATKLVNPLPTGTCLQVGIDWLLFTLATTSIIEKGQFQCTNLKLSLTTFRYTSCAESMDTKIHYGKIES